MDKTWNNPQIDKLNWDSPYSFCTFTKTLESSRNFWNCWKRAKILNLDPKITHLSKIRIFQKKIKTVICFPFVCFNFVQNLRKILQSIFKMCILGPKMTHFGPNVPKKMFSKIRRGRLCHFIPIPKTKFHAKNHKNLMNGCWEKALVMGWMYTDGYNYLGRKIPNT